MLLRAIGSNDDLFIYFLNFYLHCVMTTDANGSGRAKGVIWDCVLLVVLTGKKTDVLIIIYARN